MVQTRRKFVAKPRWAEVNGKLSYFRSNMEYYYARYLEKLKAEGIIKDFAHEPRCFWFENIKRGVRSYLPDFRVDLADGSYYFVEVKGFMDSKSKTKIKRFRKYYPNERLEVIMKL